METKELVLLQEIENLRVAHEKKEYLFVIVLAPQLVVQIIDLISSYNDEWIDRKFTSKLTEDEIAVYKIASQLQKKESDRSYIVGALVALFDSGHWEKQVAKNSFVKYFTKLDDLISLRNIYAHEYYTKKVTANRAKNCSKAGIDLAELFAGRFV